MATSSITLVSLGGIAEWVDKEVTDMLTKTVTPLVSTTTEAIMPVVVLGVSVSLLWYAWLIMNGTIQTPILQATKRMVYIVMILTIAGAGGLYQTEIAAAMLELPSDVTRVLSGTVKTPANILDEQTNMGTEIGTVLQDRAPSGLKMMAYSMLFLIVSLIITVLTAIMTAVGLIILIVVKMGMGLLVVLGPMCILGLLFEQTKRFFANWLNQVVYYAIYAAIFMLVFLLVTGMFGSLQKEILQSLKNDEINILAILTAVVFFVACARYMLEQVTLVASQISGGRGQGFSVPFVGNIG